MKLINLKARQVSNTQKISDCLGREGWNLPLAQVYILSDIKSFLYYSWYY